MTSAKDFTKKLFAVAGVGTVAVLAFTLPAGALTSSQQDALNQEHSQASAALVSVSKANAKIEADELTRPVQVSMAQLTGDTTKEAVALAKVSVPTAAEANNKALIASYYKLGYDAAELEPAIGSSDTSLEAALVRQVQGDEAATNNDAIQLESQLSGLTETQVTPAPAPATSTAASSTTASGAAATTATTPAAASTSSSTETGWRNSSFVLNVVHPVVAVGWKILIVLTVLSVIFMVRRLLRPAHGLRP